MISAFFATAGIPHRGNARPLIKLHLRRLLSLLLIAALLLSLLSLIAGQQAVTNTQILRFSSRATGAVSLLLFTAVMVLGIVTAGRAGFAAFPRATLLRLHRLVSLVAVAFLAVHVVTAIAGGYADLDYWDLVVPFGAGVDPLWIGLATVAVYLLIAIVITSVMRRHLSPLMWRGVHLTAYGMWPLAVLHGFGVAGGDGRQSWMIVIDIVCVLAVATTVAYRVRPERPPDTVAPRTTWAAHSMRRPVGSDPRSDR